jgi:primosomal protein N' (replication factor Y)
MDLDTTRRKGAHHEIITRFEKGQGDVLLGTQMVAKGHDFPGVSLVGIISADTGIHFPDFRAGERVFQLLTQAAGRSGRRDMQGEVVVQTLYPDHPVLAYAARQDYEGFFRFCIQERKDLHYPPWGRLITVMFKGKQEVMTAKAAGTFTQYIQPPSFMEILGPMSAPVSKVKNWYRYHLILRIQKQADPSGNRTRAAIGEALERYYTKTHFPDIRIGVDIDPIDMM